MDKVLKRVGNSLFLSFLVGMMIVAVTIIKLTEYWDWSELGLFALLIALLLVVPGSIIRAIRKGVSGDGGWLQGVINKHFNRTNTDPEEPDTLYVDSESWSTRMIETYRPNRRLYSLPIGYRDGGTAVELSMRGTESHLMVVGMTGTGKSTFVNQVIIAAAMSGRYQVIIADRSGKDYVTAQKMQNVHLLTYGEGESPSESRRAFATALPRIVSSINDEASRREHYLEKRGVGSTYDKRLRSDQRLTNILFVIDEFTDTANFVHLAHGAGAQREFFLEVLAVVQSCRSVGIKLMLVGQKASNQIPNDIRQQMASVTFKVKTSTESFHATGKKKAGAEELRVIDDEDNPSIPSEFLLVGAKDGLQRLNAPLTTPEDMERVALYHEDAVQFLGEPDWVWGWNKTAVPQETKQELVTVNNERETAVAVPKYLPPQIVRMYATNLFDSNHVFQSNLAPAFTRNRTIITFLALHAGMTVTETVWGVFNGKNGRYFKFVNLCQSQLQVLDDAWQRKMLIDQAQERLSIDV